MPKRRPQTWRVIFIILGLAAFVWAFFALGSGAIKDLLGGGSAPAKSARKIRVLAYSSFVSTWGPGPEIARRFQERTGIGVELLDAEDAGLLLRKLELFPADVVVGFDQLLLSEARKRVKWRPLGDRGQALYQEPEFAAFDWGPLAFVYRDEEIEPPTSLDDLASPRFKGKIAIQDPRTSSPGLQFLFWVLESKGIDEGFEFLKRLKPSVHTVAPSWSASYGLFQNRQAQVVLSYLTSPVYHWVIDKDEAYRAAVFTAGNPVQIEYAGVPESCSDCEAAHDFIRFVLEPQNQKTIMERNFMLPVQEGVEEGTPFARLPRFRTLEIESMPQLLERRAELLELWKKIGL